MSIHLILEKMNERILDS